MRLLATQSLVQAVSQGKNITQKASMGVPGVCGLFPEEGKVRCEICRDRLSLASPLRSTASGSGRK